MGMYHHILLATDFSDVGDAVTHRAKALATQFDCELSVIHVVDNLPVTDAIYGSAAAFDSDFTNEIRKAAEDKLADFCAREGVSSERQYLEMGSPKLEIVRVADEIKADLIVMGSHGRHGFGLLLGSTANGVLHHAHCDVLAVRLDKG